METSTLISLPNDIITPTAVSIWPLAWGWWLTIVALIFISIGAFVYANNYQNQSYRRQALALLKQQRALWLSQQESLQHFFNILSILKRTAITAFPRERVASLREHEWVKFLNAKTDNAYFIEEVADYICRGQYQARHPVKIDLLYDACYQWVRKHKANARSAK